MTGRVQADGLQFESRAQVRVEGGTVSAQGGGVQVRASGCGDGVVSGGHQLQKNFEDISANPTRRCTEFLREITNKDYARNCAPCMADHQKLFRRVESGFGGRIDEC